MNSALPSPNLDKALEIISFSSNILIFEIYAIIFEPQMQSKVLMQTTLLIPPDA